MKYQVKENIQVVTVIKRAAEIWKGKNSVWRVEGGAEEGGQ